MPLGVGIGVGLPHTRNKGGGVQVPFSADFVTGTYVINDEAVSLATATDFTRASTKLAANSAGVYSEFAIDTPAITDLGLSLEDEGVNTIRNSSADGGGSGVLPTNWSRFVGGGLTFTALGSGTEDGLPYFEFRLSGTATSLSGLGLWFDTNTGIDALTGETWTLSAHMRISAGSTANISSLALKMQERDEAGTTQVAQHLGTDIKGILTSARERYTFTQTLSGGASTAHIWPQIDITYANGAAVDITLRVFPQLEKSAAASSPIPTTSGAVTRAADAMTLKLPAGATRDIVATFGDTTTETIADVPAGDYAIIAANLDRPLVTDFDWGAV